MWPESDDIDFNKTPSFTITTLSNECVPGVIDSPCQEIRREFSCRNSKFSLVNSKRRSLSNSTWRQERRLSIIGVLKSFSKILDMKRAKIFIINNDKLLLIIDRH